jgi:hypothetical protein
MAVCESCRTQICDDACATDTRPHPVAQLLHFFRHFGCSPLHLKTDLGMAMEIPSPGN